MWITIVYRFEHNRLEKINNMILFLYALGFFLHIVAGLFSILFSNILLQHNDDPHELGNTHSNREEADLALLHTFFTMGLLWPLAYPSLALSLPLIWLIHGIVSAISPAGDELQKK